jgi:hypothetical protein
VLLTGPHATLSSLVFLQMFMPNLSFLGHLSGIVAGTLQLYGLLNGVMVTDRDVLRAMEEWPGVKCLSSHSGFVPTPTTDIAEMTMYELMSMWHAIRRCSSAVLRWSAYIVEAMQVIICGRGRSRNTNIQLGLMSMANSSGDEHDDEWNGLPSAEEAGRVQQLV